MTLIVKIIAVEKAVGTIDLQLVARGADLAESRLIAEVHTKRLGTLAVAVAIVITSLVHTELAVVVQAVAQLGRIRVHQVVAVVAVEPEVLAHHLRSERARNLTAKAVAVNVATLIHIRVAVVVLVVA